MTRKQVPVGSGFDAKSTASEVIGQRRLDGVLAIVTGGYAGVGLETTRVLTGAGATVIVPARTPDKARAALAGFERVELELLDLAEPKSVDAFAARFLASKRALPLLINNAGIMAAPLTRDARGFESQLATNHIGHFQLTLRLWPAIAQAPGARVIALTSAGHRRAAFDFEGPHFERREYDKWVAYGQSKTANALFALALDERGESSGVRAFSVHPGAIETDLMRHMPEEEKQSTLARFQHLMKNVEQGAATSVWCATSAELSALGGVYCENADIARETPANSEEVTGVRPWATDPQAAEKLWALSEGWTGLTLPI